MRLKDSCAANEERREFATASVLEIEHIPNKISGRDQMAMVLAADKDDLWPDAEPGQQIPARRTAHKALADDSVIREFHPAHGEVGGHAWTFLREGRA